MSISKRYDVLTFGDIGVDLILNGKDVVPEFGQKEKLVDGYSLEMGGSCTIFACQTAKLGLKTAVVGKVGNDLFGKLVCDTLETAGVSIEHITRSNAIKTGVSVALSNGTDRAILTGGDTIDAVGIADVDDVLLRSVRHLHVGSYFLMKKLQPDYPEIFRAVKQHGGTISMDTNWDPEDRWAGVRQLLRMVDVFLPNEAEAMRLTGECDAVQAGHRLAAEGPLVVMKRGERGAVAWKEGKTWELRMEQSGTASPRIVDTIGAGDNFDAGFLCGWLRGAKIEESLALGHRCAVSSLGAPGGVQGQLRP